jgi:succinate-semialdehyde dehydrogenase/glutarate-semialdehyde dehydrogenase
VCANRVFVHRSIIDEFARTLQATQEKVFTYGSVWDPKVNFGPLYSPKGIEKVKRHVEDAVSKGAKVVTGGYIKEELGPNLYVPTILVDSVPQEMSFGDEETFGPVAPLVAFDSEEEVIQLANTEQSGLASYFYTENISRLWRVAEALETGMVGVRVGLISACEQPFGGIKESGIGREGSKFGVEDYVNIKSITVGI